MDPTRAQEGMAGPLITEGIYSHPGSRAWHHDVLSAVRNPKNNLFPLLADFLLLIGNFLALWFENIVSMVFVETG